MLSWTSFGAIASWLAFLSYLYVERREMLKLLGRCAEALRRANLFGEQQARRGALLEVVSSEVWRDPVRVDGEIVVGRKPDSGVFSLGDRYMSSRHARFCLNGGRFYVTDLDTKNRTFVNDQPLTPHQQRKMTPGDTVRMGSTVLRLVRVD